MKPCVSNPSSDWVVAGMAAATGRSTAAAVSSAPGKLAGTAAATDGTGAAVLSGRRKSAGAAAATDETGAAVSVRTRKIKETTRSGRRMVRVAIAKTKGVRNRRGGR
jgi:hypothetical protein